MSDMSISSPFNKRAAIAVLALMLWLVALTTLVQAQQSNDARQLVPNQTLEREMTGAETHRYKFDLKANAFFQVRVEQKGIDITLKLLDMNGKAVAELDSPNGIEGPEVLSFIIADAGRYTVEVSGTDKKAAKGAYTIFSPLTRDATDQDRKLLLEQAKARAILDEATALFSQDKREAYLAAEAKYMALAELAAQIDDKEKQAIALAYAGMCAYKRGDNATALKNYNASLPIFRDLKDKYWEGMVIGELARNYDAAGDKPKALDFYKQSLPFLEARNDKQAQVLALKSIGDIISASGDKQKALEYYNKALPILRTENSDEYKAGELGMLFIILETYKSLNRQADAIEPLKRFLVLINDRVLTMGLFGGTVPKDDLLGSRSKVLAFFIVPLVMSYLSTNNPGLDKETRAILYNQALSYFRSINDKKQEANFLIIIGVETNDMQKAMDYFNQALQIFRSIGDKQGEANSLKYLGIIEFLYGDKQKALEYLQQALALNRSTGDKDGEAMSLQVLMAFWKGLGSQRTAIFYGKQAINKYQEMRQTIQGVNAKTEKFYLVQVKPAYRQLADLLIEEGRFAQAEQVLAMLKEEEYFDFVRRDSDEIKNLKQRVALNEKEQKLIERYALLADRITTIGQEFLKLDEKKRRLTEGASLPSDEQKHYDELSAQLTDANAAFKLFLEKELAAELGKETIKEIEYDRNLQAKLRKWGEGTVALRTVVTEDRYRVIMTTPTAQIDGKTEIKAAELNKKVFAFREALQNPKIDPRPLGKEIYDILIKPVEKDLQAAGAKTLVWSLDGTLRYVPLAALSPDGKAYLVDKYQNVIITPKTADDISDSNAEWQALGVGVSTAQSIANPDKPKEKLSFSPLPGTKEELLAIVRDEKTPTERGVLVGRRYLDNDFTVRNFTDSLTKETADGKRQYTVVHIASHFRLGSNWSNSFLVLGNGQVLTLEQLSNSPEISFGDVELITLSACNTAFADESDGTEVDSLAEAIQTKYGKAVLATLWSVADESTSILMSEFYRLRKENPQLTKAAALQRAQQEMIAGKLRPSAAKGDRRDTTDESAEAATNYSHPYFWSPFILIGNWR